MKRTNTSLHFKHDHVIIPLPSTTEGWDSDSDNGQYFCSSFLHTLKRSDVKVLSNQTSTVSRWLSFVKGGGTPSESDISGSGFEIHHYLKDIPCVVGQPHNSFVRNLDVCFPVLSFCK